MSSRRSTVSIESRVVPGTSDTMTRSRPTSAFSERRLTDVRPTEDGDPDRLLADRALAAPGQPRDDLVEQVARAVPVQRRNGDGVAETEPVELERLEVAPRVVELVREHEHGSPRAAQDLGELLVAGRDARLGVHDEEHEVGFLDRLARLSRDLRAERPRVGAVDAAGVDRAGTSCPTTRRGAPCGRA